MDKQCTTLGCPNRLLARGLCGTHYRRLWLKGEHRSLPFVNRRVPILNYDERLRRATVRFWVRVDKNGPLWNGTPCWMWQGSCTRGYGQVAWPIEGQKRPSMKKAHRIAYELVVQPIPDGLQLDHLCRNPPCCNPKHVEPVTGAINIARGDTGLVRGAQQRLKTHCPQGHPYDAENTQWYLGKWRRCKACTYARNHGLL